MLRYMQLLLEYWLSEYMWTCPLELDMKAELFIFIWRCSSAKWVQAQQSALVTWITYTHKNDSDF